MRTTPTSRSSPSRSPRPGAPVVERRHLLSVADDRPGPFGFCALPFDLETAILIAVAFFLGSLVKGVAGIGLPLVAIPILTFGMDVRDATPMIVGPAVVTNIFQILETRRARLPFGQVTPIMIGLAFGTYAGAAIAVSADPKVMLGVMGGVILAFVAFSFLGKPPRVPERGRGPMGLAAGGATGVIGGMTGVFGPVLAIYTLSLNMSKDTFVWAMGVLLLLASTGLGLSYASLGALPGWVVVASLFAVVPAYVGVVAGTRLRGVISPTVFRNIILAILAIIACKHLATAVGAA